jgi:hypothetical protein
MDGGAAINGLRRQETIHFVASQRICWFGSLSNVLTLIEVPEFKTKIF